MASVYTNIDLGRRSLHLKYSQLKSFQLFPVRLQSNNSLKSFGNVQASQTIALKHWLGQETQSTRKIYHI